MFVKSNLLLHSHIMLTSTDRLVRTHLKFLEVDIFDVVNCFKLCKNLVLRSSSSLERTFALPPSLMLQNRLWTLTIFLEDACNKPVLSKVKASFSTSLSLYWNVTNQQSPEVFVELFSTHQPLDCGKLRPCYCLQCLDLPSNYRI